MARYNHAFLSTEDLMKDDFDQRTLSICLELAVALEQGDCLQYRIYYDRLQELHDAGKISFEAIGTNEYELTQWALNCCRFTKDWWQRQEQRCHMVEPQIELELVRHLEKLEAAGAQPDITEIDPEQHAVIPFPVRATA